MRSPFLHKASRALSLVAAVTAACLLMSASADASTRSNRHDARRTVTVVGYTSERALRAVVASSGGRVVRRIPALRVAEVRTAPAALRALRGLPGIRYAHHPVFRRAFVDPALAPAPVPGGAYEWQYSTSRENLVPSSVLQAASGITVAVIDTGADVSAPDLAAKTPATWSVLSNSADTTDYQGHGTFVSSLAAGSSTNAEGVAGFGGDAKLLAVQAADIDGSISDVDEAAGIVYAVDHGAKIVNMSFGGPSTSATEQNAIDYAVSHGVLLVAAAGNSGLDGNPPMYPASLLQPLGSNGQGGVGLSVAATNVSGARASFSNYGSNISLAAPGEDVFGAISSDADPTVWPSQALPGSAAGLYGYSSGTSFASPEVAGAAALVWAANPLLTAAQVAAILKSSASGKGSWNQDTGFGILDTAAAVAATQGVAVTAPSVTFTGSRTGAHVKLAWSAPTAISYKLTVQRDGGATEVLLGATTATGAEYDLQPGHTYSFAVSALDGYGFSAVSTPYVVSLPQSAAKLTLRASRTRGHKRLRVTFWAMLAPENPATGRAARTVMLESFDGNRWRSFGRTTTSRTGVAMWTMRLRRGAYRIRARFPGALDLSSTESRTVRIRVR
jgi:subtilisin family serine protease